MKVQLVHEEQVFKGGNLHKVVTPIAEVDMSMLDQYPEATHGWVNHKKHNIRSLHEYKEFHRQACDSLQQRRGLRHLST